MTLSINKYKYIILIMIVLFSVFLFLFPTGDLELTGWRMIWEPVYTILLFMSVVFIAGALGKKIFSWFDFKKISWIEKALFSLPLGLGALAYGILGLGLFKIVSPASILIFIFIVGLCSLREMNENLNSFPEVWKNGKLFWKSLKTYPKIFVIFAGLIFGMSLSHALTPPWDYDGLMYHLVAPKIFLEQNQIVLLPDIMQANSPLTLEMLFMIGIGLGTDTFARLIHMFFAIILFISTIWFGKKILGSNGGWLSGAIILGIPFFSIMGTFAYVEMGWSVFEALALFAWLNWIKERNSQWLIISGLFLGFGMGTKYFAIANFAILGVMLLFTEAKNKNWQAIIKNSLFLGIPAVIIAAPWYFKNLVLAKNPFYPMFFGGPGWDQYRLDFSTVFLMDSFGAGRSFLDYILLPWNIFTKQNLFSTFFSSIDYPSFLFLLVFLLPFFKNQKYIKLLIFWVAGRFVLWSFGSQQIRFLFPLYLPLSILTAYVMQKIGRKLPSDYLKRTLAVGLCGGFLAVTVFYQSVLLIKYQPLSLLFGNVSKAEFLENNSNIYKSSQYIEKNLKEEDKVFFIWEAQSYFCNGACLPDAENSQWTQLVNEYSSVEGVNKALRNLGASHLLISKLGYEFMLSHDPQLIHVKAFVFLFDEFLPLCASEIYKDDEIRIYELTCN